MDRRVDPITKSSIRNNIHTDLGSSTSHQNKKQDQFDNNFKEELTKILSQKEEKPSAPEFTTTNNLDLQNQLLAIKKDIVITLYNEGNNIDEIQKLIGLDKKSINNIIEVFTKDESTFKKGR